MTAVSLHARGPMLVPSTQQALTCLECPSASSSGRTCAWSGHAMTLSGVRGVGRPWPAERVCALRGEDATRCERQRLASAVRASWAPAGLGKRWACRGKSGFSMASASRCVALCTVASARSRAAGDYPTSQRWAMPEGHHSRR
jgi:hypothetical protein